MEKGYKFYVKDLKPDPFERILNGAKTVEFRLQKEPWNEMKIGDEIVFAKLPEKKEMIRVEITKLLHGRDFGELYDSLKEYFGTRPKNDFINSMRNFYTDEQVKHFGALGLGIRVIESFPLSQDLIDLAKSVSQKRRLTDAAEINGVGAALVTINGHIYLGKAIDAACGLGLCAERMALLCAIAQDETRIAKIVAVNKSGEIMSPCGSCRDFLCQIDYENLDTEVILGKDKSVKLQELIPKNWLEKYIKS